MTWTKLSDGFIDDPVLLELSRGVRLLHIEAIVWCNRHGTDGRIPKHVLARVTDEPKLEAGIEALVGAGLWLATDEGFEVVRFLDDQPSAADVAASREMTKERTARWRNHSRGKHDRCNPRYCSKARDASGDATGDASQDASVTTPRPDPTRPARNGEEGKGRSEARSTAARSRSGGRSQRGPAEKEELAEVPVTVLGTYTLGKAREPCIRCDVPIIAGEQYLQLTNGKSVHQSCFLRRSSA